MTAKENDETIFRQVEKEVLDQHHQNLPILRRREVDAIRGLLMAYGNVLRGLRNGRIPKQNDDAKSHTANEGLRAIGHCLRWIRECCPLDSSENLPIEEVPYQEAMELLRWGVKYDPLWNQHSAYSGKLVQMEVNRPTKLITFKPWGQSRSALFLYANRIQEERYIMGRLFSSFILGLFPGIFGEEFDNGTTW